MKNYLSEEFFDVTNQLLRKMRTTCLLVIVFASSLFATNVNSQVATVNIALKNAPLIQVIRAIENQTDYLFVYDKNEIDLTRSVDVNAENQSVAEVLNQLFGDSNVEYGVVGSNIVLMPKKTIQQQSPTVSGRVTDLSNQPLPGVTVLVKGTTTGTITDFDGNYTIADIPANGTLVFSFVGMKTQEIFVGNQSMIHVKMVEEAIGIEEVVAVGYGKLKKSNLTSAVSTVDVEALNQRYVPDVAQALQGQVAGVQVTKKTGAPGDPIQVRVRGESTVGNNDPLYIIDGMQTRSINFLNPSDIESITVLKDASAAAVYGSRAASGVIVVTTKSGKAGKPSLTVDAYAGISQAVNLPTLLNTEQYLNSKEEAWNNGHPNAEDKNPYQNPNPYQNGTTWVQGVNNKNPYTDQRLFNKNLADTDWLDELFELGHVQNYQITASGGNDKTTYLLSGGFYTENGTMVFDNDRYRRFSFRTNVNTYLTDRLSIGSNLQLAYAIQNKQESDGEGPVRNALIHIPTVAVYKDKNDPFYREDDPFTDLAFYTGSNKEWLEIPYGGDANPIAMAYFKDDRGIDYKTFGNIFAEYGLLKEKELKFRTNLGIDLNFNHWKGFAVNYGDDNTPEDGNPFDVNLGRKNRPNSLSESRGESLTYTWSNTLSYVKEIGKNSINALCGSEYVSYKSTGISASRQRYEYEYPNFRYIDSGSTATGNFSNGGSGSEYSLFSFFSSINYAYNNRYLVTATFRADESSRFGKENRWGYFPSISAAWRMSQESFMKNADWISDLKVRGSWGRLGNQELPNYAFLSLLKKDGDSYVLQRYGNPNLKWETTTQNNIGLDLGLFNYAIYLSADYFVKNTTDILLPVSPPRTAGKVDATYINAGEVRNQGFEFMLTWKKKIKDFHYTLNVNMATLKNEVIKLSPSQPMIVNEDYMTRTTAGQPLNSYFGYVFDGIYQNTAEIDNHLTNTDEANKPVPGDMKFKDIDDNGIINDLDRTFIGKSIPDLTYGLNFNGGYKNIDLSFSFQGVEGIDRYNEGRRINNFDNRAFNRTTEILESWHGEGTSNTMPRVTSDGKNGWTRKSSMYIEDASYIRLKNVELGYTFKPMPGLKNLRAYLSAQNLLTFTKYKGLDPESIGYRDNGTQPQARMFIFGINCKF